MNRKIIVVLLILWVAIAYADELILDVIFTNDIHGGMAPYEATFINPDFPPMLGGGGSHAAYIQEIRSRTDGKTRDILIVDAGDFFMGHPLGSETEGEAIVAYFNAVGYDLTVIGNHEYDLGEEKLVEMLEPAEFAVLTCNVVSKETGEIVPYAQPYIIVEKMGVKIGIIGLTTTDTAQMSFPDHIKNVEFLPAKPALEKYVDKIKDEVDLVVVVGHMGLPYEPLEGFEQRYGENADPDRERRWGYDAQELAHEVEGIDLFFGGHMHRGFAEPWIDPYTHTMVFQGWAYGSGIGHVEIKIDKETKTVSGYETPSILDGALITMFQDTYIPEPEVAQLIAHYQESAEAGMDDVIGIADIFISREGPDAQSLIGNMVSDAIREYIDADFAFVNLGGVRGDIPLGPITYREVYNVMPFDNQLVVIEVDGITLKNIIETRIAGTRSGMYVSGVNVVYNRNREDFDRVTKLLVGGEPWQADKIYEVATSDFLMEGNAGLTLLTEIPESQIIRYEVNLRETIVDYIRSNTPVTAQIDDRWKRDDNAKLSEELRRELQSVEVQ